MAQHSITQISQRYVVTNGYVIIGKTIYSNRKRVTYFGSKQTMEEGWNGKRRNPFSEWSSFVVTLGQFNVQKAKRCTLTRFPPAGLFLLQFKVKSLYVILIVKDHRYTSNYHCRCVLVLIRVG